MKDSIIKVFVIIIIALLLINVILLGTWGLVALFTDKPDKPGQPATEQQSEDLPTSTLPTEVILEKSEDMGQDYIDSMIFLGDSTTYHMINRAVLTGGKDTKQVWSGASGSLTLDGMIHKTTIVYPRTDAEMTIAEAVALEKPKYMVITLGINGVSFLNENNFTAYYGKLITAIKQASPETKIILQSIFPVSKAYSDKDNGITNQKIDTANTWVIKLAKEHGCKYLDTASVLKNSEGAMIAIYDAGDGHHMTADAYKAILQYIRTHGYTE